MKVYFAGYLRDIAGISGEVPDDLDTTEKLSDYLTKTYPRIRRFTLKIALNSELVKNSASIQPNAEILVFTPLAGG